MKTSDASYIGIPYGYMGVPPKAADCWTLVRYFALRELGKHFPRYVYRMEEQSEDSQALIDKHIHDPDWLTVTQRPCNLGLIQRGDVIIMTVAGRTQHCGIYLGSGFMLHSLGQGRNSTVEQVQRWANHIESVIRWRRG